MQFIEVVAVSVLVSFCITSLGILIAARLTSFDGFNIIMNFLVMPMLFLSGAMYPVTSMPAALRHLTLFNPLTYGIDAFKHVLLRNGTPPLGPEFPLFLDLSVVAANLCGHAHPCGAVVQKEGVTAVGPISALVQPCPSVL